MIGGSPCGNIRSTSPEERVLAIENQRPDRSLNGIVVEVDTAIIKEAREAVPAGERVADRLAELALGADLAVTSLEALT